MLNKQRIQGRVKLKCLNFICNTVQIKQLKNMPSILYYKHLFALQTSYQNIIHVHVKCTLFSQHINILLC